MPKVERNRTQTTLGILNYLALKPTTKASYQARTNAKIVCHNTFCRLIKKKDCTWLTVPHFYSSQSLGKADTGSSRRRQVVLGTSLIKKQCISCTCVTGDSISFPRQFRPTQKFTNKQRRGREGESEECNRTCHEFCQKTLTYKWGERKGMYHHQWQYKAQQALR